MTVELQHGSERDGTPAVRLKIGRATLRDPLKPKTDGKERVISGRQRIHVSFYFGRRRARARRDKYCEHGQRFGNVTSNVLCDAGL